MIKSIKDSDCEDWCVLDLDTNTLLRNLIWADDETGIYCQYIEKEKIVETCDVCSPVIPRPVCKEGNIELVKIKE